MKVIRISTYRDGGTKLIETSEKNKFWIDRRFITDTPGKFYKGGYPGTEKSELMDDDLYEEMLLIAICAYENKAVNDYSIKKEARSVARNLIERFFNHGKLNILQARLSAHTHIDMLIESGFFANDETELNYWKNVKFELDNRMVMYQENPEIDNVN